MLPTIIAIDGPSGSGKSSTAKTLAKRAHWGYLDTGALYRALTWLSLEKQNTDPEVAVELCRQVGITFTTKDVDNPRTYVGDTDVSEAIRTLRITDQVSHFAQESLSLIHI